MANATSVNYPKCLFQSVRPVQLLKPSLDKAVKAMPQKRNNQVKEDILARGRQAEADCKAALCSKAAASDLPVNPQP